jgi:hypothetical protein
MKTRIVVERAEQIPALVQEYLPRVEADPKLHALSFIDPIRVARELGIEIAPALERAIRRRLRGVFTFDERGLDANGNVAGFRNLRWRPRRER